MAFENSSREITKEGAKAALERVEAKGWEVVFLGAEFAKLRRRREASAWIGRQDDGDRAAGSDAGHRCRALAKKSRDYGKGEEAEIEFNEQDRALADEEGVKERQNQ
jgi:hypothetical protein